MSLLASGDKFVAWGNFLGLPSEDVFDWDALCYHRKEARELRERIFDKEFLPSLREGQYGMQLN